MPQEASEEVLAPQGQDDRLRGAGGMVQRTPVPYFVENVRACFSLGVPFPLAAIVLVGLVASPAFRHRTPFAPTSG